MASPEVQRFNERFDRARLFEENGKWYMRAKLNGPAAEIPQQLARVAKTGLRISRNYDSAQPFGEEKEVWRGINCHRAALYAIGLIDRTDPEKGTAEHPHYEYAFFPFESFQKYLSVEDLEKFIKERVGNELGLVQIVGYQDKDSNTLSREDAGTTPKLAHTFIVKADSEGGIVCFEKVNYGPQFSITGLRQIYERAYGEKGYWNATTVEEIKHSEIARKMREELDEAKKRMHASIS